MSKEECSNQSRSGSSHVQFSLLGLTVFIATLIVATGFLTFAVARQPPLPGLRPPERASAPAEPAIPPWGELITHDTQMERPEEFATAEINDLGAPKWVFDGADLNRVRGLLRDAGLSEEQQADVLRAETIVMNGAAIVLHPRSELVFSLSPEVRERLYSVLARNPANHYMAFPFCFPGNSFDEIAASRLDEPAASWIRQLLYRRNGVWFLSDFEALMQRLPVKEDRAQVVAALSARSAVLARLRIRPGTDIDKLLGYWAPGVRLTNLRPLLESLARLEDGATISLLHFLPQFARERLYTYPLPSDPGAPAMDCHWSTMNFFNERPDNRFANPDYTISVLRSDYHTVAGPTRYGDRIFILDAQGNAIHSAVYIADDIVFTKNGNNYMEPWMLMRLNNLVAMYSVLGAPRTVVYRSRDS